jgi:hypothetical protein
MSDADTAITDLRYLLSQIGSFREQIEERRRHERKPVLWAATVEIRGKRCEGLIVDLSPGGARLRFDAEAETGDELLLVLDQFDTFGAKVIWQYDGEAGIHFVAAPADVAARAMGEPEPVEA